MPYRSVTYAVSPVDVNSARWQLDEEASQRRSRVFWQLFHLDTWVVRDYVVVTLVSVLTVRLRRVLGLEDPLACPFPMSIVNSPKTRKNVSTLKVNVNGAVSTTISVDALSPDLNPLSPLLDMAVYETSPHGDGHRVWS